MDSSQQQQQQLELSCSKGIFFFNFFCFPLIPGYVRVALF